jgi:hypothetical protein
MQITNAKIEKQQAEIVKTKAKIAEFQAKLREQDKQLRFLEDLEIVAQFRKERVSDEHLGTLRSQKTFPPTDTEVSIKIMKEDTRDVSTEN